MAAQSEMVDDASGAGDDKVATIRAAAIAEFSQRGYAATSMAHIAHAAGMSRPALYQYFRNKADIFASAFISLVEAHVARALVELEGTAAVADQLEGFVQRFEGDLYEQLSASPHAEEIIGAKSDELAAGMQTAISRLWQGLDAYLATVSPGRSAATIARRADWNDVLHLSPKGFKFDHPDVETFRRRLARLARGVAAEIEADS